ncbi:MAG: hypothetical protein AAGK25_12465 [Pseudomonadota bacterium]
MFVGTLEVTEKMDLSFLALPASTQPVLPVAPVTSKSDTIDVDAFRATSNTEKVDVDFGNLRTTSPVTLDLEFAALDDLGRVYFADPVQVDLGIADAFALF